MDLQMEGISGLEATRIIMRECPTRILIFSSASDLGRRQTVKAIQAGAIDFLPKPPPSHLNRLNEALRERVSSALRAAPQGLGFTPQSGSQSAASPSFPKPSHSAFKAVAIAVSTGGPGALKRLLEPIPASFPLPIFVAQHLPAGWTKVLAEQLNGQTALEVKEAEPRDWIRPGVVYISPGDFHLEVAKAERLRISQSPPVSGFRPSGTLLLQSLAQQYQNKALGIVLTGMGCDGLLGAEAIRKVQGTVFAQDEESSVVWGMPKSVVEAKLAQVIASPVQIGQFLAKLT